jgi:hypothetical protein
MFGFSREGQNRPKNRTQLDGATVSRGQFGRKTEFFSSLLESEPFRRSPNLAVERSQRHNVIDCAGRRQQQPSSHDDGRSCTPPVSKPRCIREPANEDPRVQTGETPMVVRSASDTGRGK